MSCWMTSVADKRRGRIGSHPYGWLFFISLILVFLSSCAESDPTQRLQGSTMGTTWHVTYTADAEAADLKTAIKAELESVNESMSTYRADSEISRINSSEPGDPIILSDAFAEVLVAALDVGARSEGAYDVTVAPLVDLWGFGAGSAADWSLPSPEQVRAVLGRVGQSALTWHPGTGTLIRQESVSLDFSSIAKGYGVDRVARVLKDAGVVNYLVEVGGEMRVSGTSPRGDDWRIAVEQPLAGQRGIAQALAVTDIAIATSGDYRNYVEVDGTRYSHTLDPRTGYPVTHDLVSVTVLHERCMMADAWATALIVAGPEEALRLASVNELAVYMMTRRGDSLEAQVSPAFNARFGAVD